MITTACVRTITLLYIYLYVWELNLRLNNVNYSCWYFSSSINHHILILNLWNTIQLKYHNQWVAYLWYIWSPPILLLSSSCYSLSSFLLACLTLTFLHCFGNSEWCIYSGNLHGRSLVPCLLKIVAKILLFLVVIFVIWFLLNLSFLHQLHSFTVFGNVSFFVTFKASLLVLFLLQSAFLCHMSILGTIEAFWLPIPEVVIGLPNVHRLTLFSVYCFCACFIVVLSLCGLVFLSHWCYFHFPLLKYLWCVVATTHHSRTNDLTTSKALQWAIK